jgi:hypothetical protein
MFNLGGGEGSMLLMLCSNIVICTMVSCFVHELIFMIFINVLQKFEDTKGVIGSRKSKINPQQLLSVLFRLLTDFVCLYTYEIWLSLCMIVRSSVILLLPLFSIYDFRLPLWYLQTFVCKFIIKCTRCASGITLIRYAYCQKIGRPYTRYIKVFMRQILDIVV